MLDDPNAWWAYAIKIAKLNVKSRWDWEYIRERLKAREAYTELYKKFLLVGEQGGVCIMEFWKLDFYGLCAKICAMQEPPQIFLHSCRCWRMS